MDTALCSIHLLTKAFRALFRFKQPILLVAKTFVLLCHLGLLNKFSFAYTRTLSKPIGPNVLKKLDLYIVNIQFKPAGFYHWQVNVEPEGFEPSSKHVFKTLSTNLFCSGRWTRTTDLQIMNLPG